MANLGGTSLEFCPSYCVNTFISQIWVSFRQCQPSTSTPKTYWNPCMYWGDLCLFSSRLLVTSALFSISILPPEISYKSFLDPPHFHAIHPSAPPSLMTKQTKHLFCSLVFWKAFNQFPRAMDTSSSSDVQSQHCESCFLFSIMFKDPAS